MFRKYEQNVAVARRKRQARGGFTLVEILIVVMILGILASIVVPRMASAVMAARETTLRDDLRFLRNQIALYKAQHHDHAPGSINGGDPDEATFVSQMTGYTDDAGNISSVPQPSFPYGPYLSTMPRNPLSDLSDVQLTIDGFPAPDDTSGWIYDPTAPEIIVNQSGDDDDGAAYVTY